MSTGVSQDETESVDEAIQAGTPGWNEVQMPFTYQNIQVPRELWQTVKDVLRADGVKQSVLENFAVLPVSIKADLMAENSIVLRGGLNHRISFIEGGGDLDLFNYVVGKGPFFIRLIPELSFDSDLHLLYISDSPGKMVEDEQWGNGCGQIYDLSEAKDQFIYDNGIHVTSSRRHYLHLMAGTFVFFQLVEERLFIGYIRLLDSRYPKFNCRDKE